MTAFKLSELHNSFNMLYDSHLSGISTIFSLVHLLYSMRLEMLLEVLVWLIILCAFVISQKDCADAVDMYL